MSRSGKPDQAEKQQAMRFARAGRLADARLIFANICQRDPNDLDAWLNLASLNLQLGAPGDAESCLVHILSRDPNSVAALMNMGGLYAAQGRFVEAADYCRRTLELDPDLPVAHYNLANALGEQGLIEAAIDSYREALRLDPDHSDSLNNLGNLLRNTGRLGMAADCFNRILEMEPGNAAAYNNRGTVEKDMGLLSEAMASARKAWELEPASHQAASNLLSILNYVPDLAPVVVYEKHRDWARSLEKMVDAHPRHANTPDPDRQLKIGYVSPDFREHSISYFFTPLLMHHDPTRFKTFCYALTPSTDGVARKLQGLAHHWRPIHGLKDAQITAAIQADGVDILVDLAGHTGGNRLPVFAHRPAPVQLS
ncbi:MAG: tetratricopeptide repeat protein, partial [Gammaproteobacteria bacterium]